MADEDGAGISTGVEMMVGGIVRGADRIGASLVRRVRGQQPATREWLATGRTCPMHGDEGVGEGFGG